MNAPPEMTRRLHIGLDATPLRAQEATGTANFLARLVDGLLAHPAAPALSLFCAGGMTSALAERQREWQGRAPERFRLSARWFSRSGWASFGAIASRVAPVASDLTGPVDVFHAGDGAWPSPDGTPLVASVLDVTPLLFPQYHTAANRIHHWRKLRWTQRAARRVQCISEATKRDVVSTLRIPPEAIDVIPLARGLPLTADSPEHRQRVRHTLDLGDGPFVLCTGTLEPRKNHLRLVQAFENLTAEFPGLHLVLAGAVGWRTSELAARLRNSPVASAVRCIGFCETADLWALYREATVFAYPSLYEGFGLPLLEAMAVGTPVVTSQVASMPEVAGQAAIYCDPTSVSSITTALRAVLTHNDLRRQLSQAGRAREQTFTWDRTADLTLASYVRAIGASQA